MTDAARQTAGPDGRAGRGRFVALGIPLIVLGVVASLDFLVASVCVVGALMLPGGAALIAQAFRSRGGGGQPLSVLSGVPHALAGVLAFANPPGRR